MESKPIPTAEEFMDLYANKMLHHNWTEFCAFESKGTVIQETKKMSHEYAVLFARHHVSELKSEIKHEIINECSGGLFNHEMEVIQSIVENACPIDLIK